MFDNFILIRLKYTHQSVRACLSGEKGNILVYVVIVMVIFGLLGALMVSLFSTSIGSSATANESRRAFYLAEAGLRYGLSELRQKGFSTSNIATLNTTEYKMPPSGNFDITVFGAWFKSPSNQSPASGALSVEIGKGKIPADFFDNKLPAVISELYLVVASLDPRSANQKPNPAEVAKVNGFSNTAGNYTSFTFDLADDFVVGKDKAICMAIKPASARTFTPSGDSDAYLFLLPAAGKIFPKTDGSFLFTGRTFFYKTATQESNGNIKINNITSASSAQVDVQQSDYILLAPGNYFVTSKGTSGQVTFGGDLDNSASLADHAFHSEADGPPITGTGPENDPKFIRPGTDEKGDYLKIGEKTNQSNAALGAMWSNQSLYLGGTTDYCIAGECLFERGIRVFFTLEYAGSGDGLIFSLINGASNSSVSIGGDLGAAELLGYSGDGRLDAGGTLFIPGSTRNLNPPKMGLEFDTKINYSSTQEEFLKYCTGSNLNACTRTDPEVAPGSDTCLDPASGLKDAVQYVFWGNSSLNVPCRKEPYCGGVFTCKGDPSYDDNRHNALGDRTKNWSFYAASNIESSPALLADGTIIFGTENGRLYGLSPDGSFLGYFPAYDRVYSPTVSDGTIYFGSQDRNLYAIGSNGNLKWSLGTGGAVRTKPAVPGNGKVYFGSDDRYLYALFTSNGEQAWSFDAASPVQSSPALSASKSRVYFGNDIDTFYAVNADTGAEIWKSPPLSAFRSSPAVGPDGTVYVGSDGGYLYAFDGATGDIKWSKYAGGAIRSSPAVGVLADGTVLVYFGSDSTFFYALNADNGSEKWSFKTGSKIQSPIAVDGNNHIYFGSDDNYVYAFYPDGSLKWSFKTEGDLRGKPLVKDDGTVYVGSSASLNSQLYAINQFANPKNYRDRLITYNSGSVGGVPVNVEGSGDDWLKGVSGKRLWAVRMEIWRDICDPFSLQPCTPPPPGTYSLKTWLRQCGNIDGKNDCSDVIGTFYEDTRVFYSPTTPTARPAQLEQTINLLSRDHQDFERFLFGFTSQTASGDLQTATIRNFQLSFIRPNDPTITEDTAWP